nr:immunoglobulin heavy chain junction region [Mus musculus]MBK4195482.1 immunoglobulin heavy chain junction region [Mus musculus]MBK4195483.1 immunoglobulin heavy chain junction region [Mus musculus]MBK4195484.1 immunoglobulin heavy chain junction region [Mus musculus]
CARDGYYEVDYW